jgi:hypothetical protein
VVDASEAAAAAEDDNTFAALRTMRRELRQLEKGRATNMRRPSFLLMRNQW